MIEFARQTYRPCVAAAASQLIIVSGSYIAARYGTAIETPASTKIASTDHSTRFVSSIAVSVDRS